MRCVEPSPFESVLLPSNHFFIFRRVSLLLSLNIFLNDQPGVPHRYRFDKRLGLFFFFLVDLNTFLSSTCFIDFNVNFSYQITIQAKESIVFYFMGMLFAYSIFHLEIAR